MYKKWIIVLNLIFILNLVYANDVKIGLTLSGGGAKGFAHIGVLKVLEKEHIPIDYISGTSMGSIVGALYSIGYSAKEIENIALNTNWFYYFDDEIDYKNLPIEEKIYSNRYIGQLPLKNYTLKIPGGLIEGQKIESLLRELTWDAKNIRYFNKLKIPFSCVATNLKNGDAVVLKSGILSEAIRASMSIPSVFTPIKYKNMLLVDGMLSRNFPVQEVLDMGADVVIGSDVGAMLKDEKDLNTFLDVANQSFSFRGVESSLKERKKVDVLIVPKLGNYGATSYRNVKELIKIGEEAAEKMVPKLKNLRNEKKYLKMMKKKNIKNETAIIKKIKIVGVDESEKTYILTISELKIGKLYNKFELEKSIEKIYRTMFFKKVSYEINKDELILKLEKKENNLIGLAFRYDSYLKSGILLNYTNFGYKKIGFKSILDLKLGENPFFTHKLIGYKGINNKFSVIMKNQYKELPFYLYNEGQTIAKYKYNNISSELLLGSFFSTNTFLGGGVKLEYYNAVPEITEEKLSVEDYLFLYDFDFKIDTTNRKNYPEKGNKLFLNYILGNSFLLSNSDFNKLTFDYKKYFKLNVKNILEFNLTSIFVEGNVIPENYYIYIGGEEDETRFYGVKSAEYSTKNFISIRLENRYEFSKDRYFIVGYNYGKLFSAFQGVIDKKKDLHGFAVGIGARTLIGPINLMVLKEKSSDILIYFNTGFKF
ncbi:patatin-like phospholipase family protein [Haliovirga abyssi]|uniref:Patatin n=1 Tax=Haliovirga abyssi TaxID=2996794 RepID=A0AAU9DU87_9FUSO|nr:patatin-like phospholipase family protein [Haliovirga abyssi]BDU50829.1 patatin [Haliovirga abyssi]